MNVASAINTSTNSNRDAQLCADRRAGATYSALGAKYGLTSERCQQICNRAFDQQAGSGKSGAEIAAERVVNSWIRKVADYQDCVDNPEGRHGGRECLPQWEAALRKCKMSLAAAEERLLKKQAARGIREQKERFNANCFSSAP